MPRIDAERLIGDRAYDSDPLDDRLWRERGIEMILNLDNPNTRELLEQYRELELDPDVTYYTPGNLTVPISVALPESR